MRERKLVWLLLLLPVLSSCGFVTSAKGGQHGVAADMGSPETEPMDMLIPTATLTSLPSAALTPTLGPTLTPLMTTTATTTSTPTVTPTITPVQIVIVSNGSVCALDRQGVFYVCSGSSFSIGGLKSATYSATYRLFVWDAQGKYEQPYATGILTEEIRPNSPAVHVQIISESGVLYQEFDVYVSGLATVATPVKSEDKGEDGEGEDGGGTGGPSGWDDSWGDGDG